MNKDAPQEKTMLIYSPNEAAISGDGAGFWNNDLGWTILEEATRFTREESQTLNLPMSTGNDCQWLEAASFEFNQDVTMEP